MRNLGRVGMIFNGGGLAGCYSIGFVKALADKGIKPDYVQGVSVGALTSAILVSTNWNVEKTEKIWLEIQELGYSSVFNWKDIPGNLVHANPALFNDSPALRSIIHGLNLQTIIDSPIKYHIIANNRNKKKITAFSNHDPLLNQDPTRLHKILTAAIGLYGVLPSVLIDSDWYGDGMSFMLNEAIKARCDTIFILLNDQFGQAARNYGELPFYRQFVSGFHDVVMQLDEREIKYARGRGYDVIENNPSGRFEDANPLHKKIRRRLKHLIDETVEAATTDCDVSDIFSSHRIVILTPPSPIPTLHTLGFKRANAKIGYPGDISLAIEQCSKFSEEFWNKI